MQLTELKPRKALNKAFLKIKPRRIEIEGFKVNLIQLMERINAKESEEFHKNLISDFLKKSYYDSKYFINTKGRNDLVIHNGNSANSSVGVIIEVKKPGYTNEMVSSKRLNTKAFQELVLYYLRERFTHKNLEVKHLIITNINEWYIFDVIVFERLFAQNKSLVQQFQEFEGGRLADIKTDFFYKQIAEPFIGEIKAEIEFTYFNLQEYGQALKNSNKTDSAALISLFKLLSPEHLLKLPFINDSNSLDRQFYSELLHIIGLAEIKSGGKGIIQRNNEAERNSGSILESAIIQLDSRDKINRLDNPNNFGNTKEEQLLNVALELSITWINRILFLKLLEAQLVSYHGGDKSLSFLNSEKIKNFDDLDTLFFQVLAKKAEDRNERIKKPFQKVPYMNSTLFEPTELEQVTLFVSNLEAGMTIPLISTTVLKNQNGKRRIGNLTTLEYLLEFLDAYDFRSEGGEGIQEDNKTLINASVLGLIFEKINGYKDGSFFTPGFITMYMCRETIRRTIIQKFNDVKQWNCTSVEELYNKIEDRDEANNIVLSVKICDPAVGSGHFLVSVLNEIIAIKHDLKILLDRDKRRLKEYQVEVVNDELIVTDEEGKLFEYNPNNKESQRVQEMLFHEKQNIIENCLFGVDINHNSVKICRLRLWIELLKNAYYKNDTELETLPNIDINIKCGNSLISRFTLDADLRKALEKSKWSINSYKLAVDTYRNAVNKQQKREMEKMIAVIKSDFRTNIDNPFKRKISSARGKADKIATEINIRKQWGEKPGKELLKDLEKATKQLKKLEVEKEDIETNKIYENAFEWRFEFPEVLDDNGNFVGFDAVIGNPPYVVVSESIYSVNYKTAKCGDLYCYFFELGKNILRPKGFLAFITPSLFIKGLKFKSLREFLLKETSDLILEDKGDRIFENVAMPTALTFFKNLPNNKQQNWESLFVTNPISQRMKMNTKMLGEIAKIQRGLEIGKNKTSDNLSAYPLITGEDIERYRIKKVRFIDAETYREFIKGDLDYYKKPRVLIRETGSSITCVYLDELLLSNRSLYSILPIATISARYLLAVLCSKLMQFFYQSEFKAETTIFPKIRIAQVKLLPVKVISENEQQPYIDLVDQIISEKQNLSINAEGLEDQINLLVYQLYNLTDEEISIVEDSIRMKSRH